MKNVKDLIIKKNHAIGIVNIGTTCYMNATIQFLAHAEHLTKHFLKLNITNKIKFDRYK